MGWQLGFLVFIQLPRSNSWEGIMISFQATAHCSLLPLRDHIHIEIKSCRIENKIRFVTVYRTWPTWTDERTNDSCTKKFATTTMPLFHLAFKNALLRAFKGFRVWEAWTTNLLAQSCNELFSAPNSNVSRLFGLTMCWVHKPAFGYIFISTSIHVPMLLTFKNKINSNPLSTLLPSSQLSPIC